MRKVLDPLRRLVFLVSVLALVAGVSAPATAAAGTPAVSPPTPGMLVSLPKTNGDIVVWAEEAGTGTINADILGAHLSDGKVFAIASGPENQTNPEIDGSVVIWMVVGDTNELHARDLNGGNEVVVASLGSAFPHSAVSGHTVVWATGNDVVARDISTMAEPVTVATVPDGWSIGALVISGPKVAWVEQTVNPNRTYPWQVRVATIGGSGSAIAGSGVAIGGSGIGLAESDNTLVYTVGGVTDPIYGQLYAVNLYSFASTLVAGDAAFPTTDGRYIFWQTHNGVDAPPEVEGYDLQSNSRFKPPTTALTNGVPDLNNGALVWQTSTQQNLMVASLKDIEAAYLWQVLPSGPRPNPGKTSPNWLYFPETNHYLSFGFKTFWQQSGGLAVFGYPMTEEYQELNKDLNQMMIVQYLERQRFEYHPELAGTPYETSLGRLGAEEATQRNLVVTRPFQPLPAGTQSTANCQFFGVTRHLVCSGFKDYWMTHGLEFGDSGVSYRESLALFGFPISEEFVDPQTGFVTQFFERAVFEYHPENAAPYQVLLKRLGAVALAQRGW